LIDWNKICKSFWVFSIVSLRLAMKMSMRFDVELHPFLISAPSGNERSSRLYTPFAPRLSERNLRKPQSRSECGNTAKDFIQDQNPESISCTLLNKLSNLLSNTKYYHIHKDMPRFTLLRHLHALHSFSTPCRIDFWCYSSRVILMQFI
jgi:hypothetical protein